MHVNRLQMLKYTCINMLKYTYINTCQDAYQNGWFIHSHFQQCFSKVNSIVVLGSNCILKWLWVHLWETLPGCLSKSSCCWGRCVRWSRGSVFINTEFLKYRISRRSSHSIFIHTKFLECTHINIYQDAYQNRQAAGGAVSVGAAAG